MDQVWVDASAFNLKLKPKNLAKASVESLYQGSKVFENGGPFIDLYQGSALAAKKDERIKTSGELIGFHFQGVDWGLNDFFMIGFT